jgi:hypothetical protein
VFVMCDVECDSLFVGLNKVFSPSLKSKNINGLFFYLIGSDNGDDV